MSYEHGADPRRAAGLRARAASCSTAARTPRRRRPYRQRDHVRLRAVRGAERRIEGFAVYTNNPPCGAMRGFGAVQVALRLRGADGRARRGAGHGPRRAALPQRAAGGQRAADRPGDPRRPRRCASCSSGCATAPLPAARRRRHRAPARRRAGARRDGEGVRRGVGYAVGFKNIAYSEGFDDFSTARVRLVAGGGRRAARRGPQRGQPRSGRASPACRRRSPARSSASSGWRCCRPTRASARPAPPRPRARPTWPAGR